MKVSNIHKQQWINFYHYMKNVINVVLLEELQNCFEKFNNFSVKKNYLW